MTVGLLPHEQTLVLEWSRAEVPLREQARRLGKKPTALVHTIRRFQAAGDLPKRGVGTGRPWTEDDVARFEVMIDEGRSYDWIARKLRRSRTGVILKARRLGHRVTTTDATLSARDAARILGLGCSKTVVRWIVEHGLPARNAGTKQKPLWRITPDTLVAWLERPEHWMMYDPVLITDPFVRDQLARLRPATPYWLPIGEAARQLGVTHEAVNTWIANGLLPATRYGNWWVCASDLATFTPPCERPRTLSFNRNTLRVVTPRRSFATVHKFAKWAGASCQQVHRYLVQNGNRFVLRPLSDVEYEARAARYRQADPSGNCLLIGTEDKAA